MVVDTVDITLSATGRTGATLPPHGALRGQPRRPTGHLRQSNCPPRTRCASGRAELPLRACLLHRGLPIPSPYRSPAAATARWPATVASCSSALDMAPAEQADQIAVHDRRGQARRGSAGRSARSPLVRSRVVVASPGTVMPKPDEPTARQASATSLSAGGPDDRRQAGSADGPRRPIPCWVAAERSSTGLSALGTVQPAAWVTTGPTTSCSTPIARG